jgi:phosphate transport system substrate-binding protein
MKNRLKRLGAAALIAVFVAACGGSTASSTSPSSDALSGEIAIDGSSTVYPITEAVAE